MHSLQKNCKTGCSFFERRCGCIVLAPIFADDLPQMMEITRCLEPDWRKERVSFHLAFSHLETLANRLWKISEPDGVDVVYGRIWLHSLELANRLSHTTVADVLAGIDFTETQISVSVAAQPKVLHRAY
jgi:hypothetical protein